MGARFLRRQQRDEAGFARCVTLVDHRPPPVDHLLLHFGRAGRAGGGDVLDRGEVVLALHLVGQAQQAHHVRRHQIEPVELVRLDVGEQPLGIVALMDEHEIAVHQALHAVGSRRRVIERRDDRGAHALADAEHGLRDLDHALHLVGRWRTAQHALRPAGGAGGIRHRAMHLPRRASIGGVAREPALPLGRARRNAALLGRDAERGARLRRSARPRSPGNRAARRRRSGATGRRG